MKRWHLVLIALAVASCKPRSTGTTSTEAGAPPVAAGGWTKTGMAGANIVPTLAADTKVATTVYAGVSAGSTDQGFFRTKDAGKTWEKLSGGLPARYAGIVVVGQQTGTVLVNPGVEGIWRSTNHGDSFVRASAEPGSPNALLYHPTTVIVWAVTSQQGCFRSNDDGVTWAKTPNTGLPLNQFSLGPLAYDGAKLYLGTGGKGVYVSGDHGNTWAKAPSAGLPDGADAVGMATGATGTLLVETAHAGLFRSTDSGASFAKVEATARHPALAIHEKNRATAYVSADENGGPGGLLETTNGGQTWSPIGPKGVHVLAVAIALDGSLYAGTTGQGVWHR